MKMISSIVGGGLILTQQSVSYNNGVSMPHSAVPGSVWYDGHLMKVSTGSGWEIIQGDGVHLTTSTRLNDVVSWAEKKMADEAREAELQEKFPALKQAKENYDIIRKMVAE